MKKIILLFSLCGFSFAFSQSQDLTKKQAYEAFKNSEISKLQNINIKYFNKTYNEAKCLKKAYNIKLKDMPIFKKELSEKEKSYKDLQFDGIFRQWLFGLDNVLLPKKDDNGNLTITCGAFKTADY